MCFPAQNDLVLLLQKQTSDKLKNQDKGIWMKDEGSAFQRAQIGLFVKRMHSKEKEKTYDKDKVITSFLGEVKA